MDRGRRKAAAGVASAALAAAVFAAPGTGLAQKPVTTTTATTPDPAPAPTTTEPPPTLTAPEPAPAVPEPAPAPAPAAPDPAPTPPPPPPSARPPALFLPGLSRKLVTPPGTELGDAPTAEGPRDVLGTNRGTDPRTEPPADGGEGGELGSPLGATGASEVPSFFIDSFAVPPFLLPIYQAAGIEYGVPWQVLAAINEVETNYGRNVRVSSAGAVGWMQFLPATFAQFGVDAGGDGRADPYNPADAIFSAANYLRAAGAGSDLAAAILAYNHSPAYVATVLARARLLGGLPDDLVAALTGLAQGRPPVAGATTAIDRPKADAATLRLRTRPGAQVLAVADGVVTGIGRDRRLGRWLRLRDVYGNTYTYGALARTARRYPLPRAASPARPAAPAAPVVTRAAAPHEPLLASTDWSAVAARALPAAAPAARAAAPVARRPLRTGSRVLAGTTLAYVGRVDGATGRLAFEIRPAGRDAPRIEAGPVVEGWKLLRASAHATSLLGAGAGAPAGIGRVLLLDKRELQREVLRDDAIAIGPCGRRDIRAGRVDRRVLATLKFLALSGLAPTIGGLRCAQDTLATGIDVVAVNGVPIAGNQGPGSVGEATARRLLALQGVVRPQQILSRPEHIHIGFAPAAAATTLEARGSDGVLPASSWRRLSRRLGAIVNPSVP